MKNKQLVLFEGIDVPLKLPPIEKLDIYVRIEEVTSKQTATRFAEIVAGLAVYIPNRVDSEHWISEAVGQEDAQKICDLITDGFALTMDFPLGENSTSARQRTAAADLINEGDLSANEIAASINLSRRTVQRIKSQMKSHSLPAKTLKD